MTAVSKNVYIKKLDQIIDKYNNTYQTIKTKPADIKEGTYVGFNVEKNNKDPDFIVSYQVRISKHKNI